MVKSLNQGESNYSISWGNGFGCLFHSFSKPAEKRGQIFGVLPEHGGTTSGFGAISPKYLATAMSVHFRFERTHSRNSQILPKKRT
jgi:hypothetical protein